MRPHSYIKIGSDHEIDTTIELSLEILKMPNDKWKIMENDKWKISPSSPVKPSI
jgi:hypothetical protein